MDSQLFPRPDIPERGELEGRPIFFNLGPKVPVPRPKALERVYERYINAFFASTFGVGYKLLLEENLDNALVVKQDTGWWRSNDRIRGISSRRGALKTVGTDLKGEEACRAYIEERLEADGIVCIHMSRLVGE